MFPLSFRFWMVTSRVGDVSLSERDVYNIMTTEISRFTREDFPRLISIVMEELIAVVNEHLRILQAKLEDGWPWGYRVTFEEFDACGAPCFFSSREPIIIMCLVVDMVSSFQARFYPAKIKVRLATCILHDKARDWW